MIADKIKQYRIAAGLTQAEMAQSLEASQNTISQYETGKRTPTIKNLIKISVLLGCSVDDLTT